MRVQVDQIYSTSRVALAEYGLRAYSEGFDTVSAKAIPLARGVEAVEVRSLSGDPIVIFTRRVGGSTNSGFEEVFVAARWHGHGSVTAAEGVARSLASRP
jgi:hypothetical protein